MQFCSRMSLILGSKKAISTSIATTCGSKQPVKTGRAQAVDRTEQAFFCCFLWEMLCREHSRELGSQWKSFLSLNWAAVVLWISHFKQKQPILKTAGKRKLSVDSMCPWGQLDWFALNQNYPTWRLIYLFLQFMQMAAQPFNYMISQVYPQARWYHFAICLSRLSLWLYHCGKEHYDAQNYLQMAWLLQTCHCIWWVYTCSAVERDTCSCLNPGKLGLLVTTLVIYCAAAWDRFETIPGLNGWSFNFCQCHSTHGYFTSKNLRNQQEKEGRQKGDGSCLTVDWLWVNAVKTVTLWCYECSHQHNFKAMLST